MNATKLPLLLAVCFTQVAAEKDLVRFWTSRAPRLPASGRP